MTKRFRYNFSFKELKIDIDQIGRLLDYEKGGNKSMISGMIADALTEAEALCDLKAEFALIDEVIIEKDTLSLSVNNVGFDIGKIITGQLKRSVSIALFVCTAGEKIGATARAFIHEKDFLKGYILDIIGSQAADSTADLMQEKLKELIEARGMKITNRYSPGYCGWDVSEQHKLFSLLPDNYCGIILNESALMQPVKSVSGIIGIGEKVKFNQYTCNLCDQQNCIYRNTKFNSVP
jgi:hypothetical protein